VRRLNTSRQTKEVNYSSAKQKTSLQFETNFLGWYERCITITLFSSLWKRHKTHCVKT